MNKKQKAIALQIESLLNKANSVGLRGGVFDCVFCLWADKDDEKIDRSFCGTFFEDIEKIGFICESSMNLDGGAGV